ncbi:hypothetical protein JCM10207_005221 [Rhodosporidiobolus poonsookiae]
MVYDPLASTYSSYQLPTPSDSHSTSARYDTASPSAYDGIRPIDSYTPYDSAGGDDYPGDDSFINDQRPPSFHSDEHGSGPAGVFRPSETYASDLNEVAQTAPLRLPSMAHRTQHQRGASYDPDLELHLDSSPAPVYSRVGGRHGREDDYREDVKDPGEFEESFEAGRGDEEDGDGPLHSPALSYHGEFGTPPAAATARRNNLTNRRVKLTEGNLVIPCAIPTRLLGFLPRKDGDEFTQSRYTAVTCGPEDFHSRNYTLRPTLYNRQTELFVVITMYNEDEELFCRTLHGVMKNISQLCKRKKSATWGQDGWKKVVVCIVADGRKAIHPRVLDCLSALGVYQPNVATNKIDDKPVQAHIYEHTTQMSIAPDLTFKGLEKGIMPTQIMFCLKENNAKKINSHRWALQAFAPQLEPNVVMLIDVGTKPGPSSLYLWKAFDMNSNVGGACGEIVAMKGKFWMNLLMNPLVAAQNFEYKTSNILDKPLESICGYISVLPGAFSAYRYIALKNDELGHGPLASYFKGEHLAGHDADLTTSNMYLAEDRILCWELVAKRGESWVLKYVKAAKGETDVPDTVPEFISQRRRWLNGSFFAGVYALTHTMQLFGTQHSRKKIFVLILQAIYNFWTVVFAWIGLSSYWIFFSVLTKSLEDPSFNIPHIEVANVFASYLYMGAVIATFLMSMGNRPKAAKWHYITVMVIFSVTTLYMFVAAGICVYHAVKQSDNSLIMAQIVISLASTYGVYILSALIALDPWHIVTSMAQYMLMAPIYINVLNIYAFANLHDFSWGTKEQNQTEIDLGITRKVGRDEVDMALPSDQTDIDAVYDGALHNLKTRPMIVPPPLTYKQKEEAVRDHYQSIRTNILLAWVLTNAVLIATILEGDYASTFSSGGGNGRTQIYLVIILIFVAIMSLIRFVGSTAFVIDWYVRIVGAFVQRKLFARRQVSQGKTLQPRRNAGGAGSEGRSEAGTEVNSEKVDKEEEEEEDGDEVDFGVGAYDRAEGRYETYSDGRETAPVTNSEFYLRG